MDSVNIKGTLFLQSSRVEGKGKGDIGVEIALQFGKRRNEIVKARRVVSLLSVKAFGYSGAEVALYFGVTNSCVTSTVSTGKRPEVERYVE